MKSADSAENPAGDTTRAAGQPEPNSEVAHAAGQPDPDEVLDCLGQRCPLPVIALARRLPELPLGTVIRVLADDPAAAIDIPAWCRMRDQEFVGAATAGEDRPAYDVRRCT